MQNENVRILDLYCGMGGLSLGFAIALHAEINGLDINKWAVKTYNYNLNQFNCRASVCDVFTYEPIEKYDIVIGGSPCQPFSFANKTKRGENHPYFPTLHRFFELVAAIKPKLFVMENVKGLISKKFRHYLLQELYTVSDYNVKYNILNSANYGVPQTRERLITVGIRKDIGKEFEYPRSTHRQNGENGLKKWITLKEAIEDIMYLLPVKTIYKKQSLDTLLIAKYDGTVYEKRWTTYMKCHPPLDLNRPSKTLLTNPSDFLIPVAKIDGESVYRKLTIREFLRIQTFPDWWGYPDDCPQTQRYHLIGEAVPPILAYHIAVAVGKALNLKIYSPTEELISLPFYNKIF